jgi:hypothetical protein
MGQVYQNPCFHPFQTALKSPHLYEAGLCSKIDSFCAQCRRVPRCRDERADFIVDSERQTRPRTKFS